MNKWLYSLELLWEIIAPRRCEVCEEEITSGAFCLVCREHFFLLQRTENNDALDKVYMLFKYQHQLRDLIRATKFNQRTRYLWPLREEAECAVARMFTGIEQQYDALVTIPTSKERREKRGFDLPAEIFSFLNIKLEANLIRNRQTMSLFALNASQRRQELADCFSVKGNVANKKILLLDDIYTTGATGREAARTLKIAGAKQVDMLAFSAGKDNWEDEVIAN